MVVTGDLTQVDLPTGKRSGLNDAVEVLRGIEGISFVYFDDRDVVRHPLVQKIVKAYERHQEAIGGRQLALRLSEPTAEAATVQPLPVVPAENREIPLV
jgi:phosphate starvation-inducible PhoH-like protein